MLLLVILKLRVEIRPHFVIILRLVLFACCLIAEVVPQKLACLIFVSKAWLIILAKVL